MRRAGSPKPLLVGEQNPYGADPRLALYPLPAGATGARLVQILGMTPTSYLERFDRANLLPYGERWTVAKARAAAHALPNKLRIALGSRVAAAHGLLFDPFEAYEVALGHPQDVGYVLILPHPSGRCRIWNDPESIPRAREAVERFVREMS